MLKVERISNKVYSILWSRSINVLKSSVEFGLRTKTGIMVGLGETQNEVIESCKRLDAGGIFTIGQYLQPTKKHLPVARYVENHEFLKYMKKD